MANTVTKALDGSKTTTTRMFQAKVKNTHYLGHGFSKGMAVTTWRDVMETEGEEPHTIVRVYNGSYGIRELTTEQAREVLELSKRLTEKEEEDMRQRYEWELWR